MHLTSIKFQEPQLALKVTKGTGHAEVFHPRCVRRLKLKFSPHIDAADLRSELGVSIELPSRVTSLSPLSAITTLDADDSCAVLTTAPPLLHNLSCHTDMTPLSKSSNVVLTSAEISRTSRFIGETLRFLILKFVMISSFNGG